ncbi:MULTISPECIES: integrase [Pseudomonas]|uniref:integrase n=1 Tax=Pseudomonas TaxID=286 RepID=UPI0016481A7C|nr:MULTISPECIES: integrase [Pseudomonas]MBC3410218.1 integrase [Pseudomonas sp. SWRI51]MDD2075052.1 integrase [Pseudomonas putida]WRW01622.1 integrase [Pseudomonas putida]HDS1690662.1 integrase [Pseudomonas putida]
MDTSYRPNTERELSPVDLKKIPTSERDLLPIAVININKQWIIVSRFGDDKWQVSGHPKNRARSHTIVDFSRYPAEYRDAIKEIAYRYLIWGREGTRKPKGSTLRNMLNDLLHFIRYLKKLGVTNLKDIPKIIFHNFAQETSTLITARGKPIAKLTISRRFLAIEALFELSQHTNHPLKAHPWPETSALGLARLTGSNAQHKTTSSTPLMPDLIFSSLFAKSHELIKNGSRLLDIRDDLDEVKIKFGARGQSKYTAERKKVLENHNYENGASVLREEIIHLRTACYIVISSTSGCRNHELANLKAGGYHDTIDDDGETYYWISAESEKTYAGICNWMIPSIGIDAVKIMERFALPYQAMIADEIARREKTDPFDPEIAIAKAHQESLFLGVATSKNAEARTLSVGSWNKQLKKFVELTGLDWNISSHQFRKKFANYVAHSKFGDLRYLKEHFKHWSMDMTLGYALDDSWAQSFDLELYDEIETELAAIKKETVESWLDESVLAGGYGASLKEWQRDPDNLALFKNHASMIKSISESTAIRSNGHAWCTADNNACIGNSMDRGRCSDCSNAAIGQTHVRIYEELYANLKNLLDVKDIGEAGIVRITRDIERYAAVLTKLGHSPEKNNEQL